MHNFDCLFFYCQHIEIFKLNIIDWYESWYDIQIFNKGYVWPCFTFAGGIKTFGWKYNIKIGPNISHFTLQQDFNAFKINRIMTLMRLQYKDWAKYFIFHISRFNSISIKWLLIDRIPHPDDSNVWNPCMSLCRQLCRNYYGWTRKRQKKLTVTGVFPEITHHLRLDTRLVPHKIYCSVFSNCHFFTNFVRISYFETFIFMVLVVFN